MSLPTLAQNLASQGRYGDSMLMHVSPGEVYGLQALAQANGTSLTINPNTGLPEAFSLKRLLPTIAGIGLTMMGVPAPIAAGIIGVGTAATTGSLEKGLVAGLGAYGGSSLAGSAANLAAPATQVANTAAAGATSAATAGGAATAVPGTFGADLASQNLLPQVTPLGQESLLQAAQAPAAEMAGTGAFDLYGTGPVQVAAMPQATLAAAPPTPTTADLVSSGFDRATSSLSDFGGYLNNNKMNLAMAASPLLLGDSPEYAPTSSPQMIRPFDLVVDNISGEAPYSPTGVESQQLTYTFTPRDPYEASEAYKRRTPFSAAKGGVVAFQEGGVAQTTSAPAAQQISPSMARSLQNIALVQGLAGLPQVNTQGLSVAPVSRPAPLMPAAIPSTQEIYTPPATAPTTGPLGVSSAKARRSRGPVGTIFGGLNNVMQDAVDVIKGTNSSGSTTTPTYTNIVPGMPNPMDSATYRNMIAEQERQRIRDEAAAAEPVYHDQGGGAAAGGMMPQGLAALAKGGKPAGRFLNGPGDGVSDSIPAVIGNKQPARLADGEFVIDARTVSEIGNGSSKAGAKKLYAMMDRVHKARKKAGRGKDSKADRFLPA